MTIQWMIRDGRVQWVKTRMTSNDSPEPGFKILHPFSDIVAIFAIKMNYVGEVGLQLVVHSMIANYIG